MTCKEENAQNIQPRSAPRQRQAKRLRAELVPPDYSTIATGLVQCPTIAMTSPVTVHRFSASALFSLWAENPPLPVAEEGGFSAPQPRPWRAVAKQAREGQMRQGGRTVSLFAQDRKEKWVLICAETALRTARGTAFTPVCQAIKQRKGTPRRTCLFQRMVDFIPSS